MQCLFTNNQMKHCVKDSSNESNCSLCPSSSNEMNVHKNDIIETVIFQGVFLLFVDFPPIRKLFGYKKKSANTPIAGRFRENIFETSPDLSHPNLHFLPSRYPQLQHVQSFSRPFPSGSVLILLWRRLEKKRP